jgi:uncharacterized iron-regulated membrane protein
MSKVNKRIRKLHKWISVTVGAFFLVWLFSGVVMVVPVRWLVNIKSLVEGSQTNRLSSSGKALLVPSLPTQPDFESIEITIPQAIVALEAELGHEVQVSQIAATRIGEGLAYEITLEDGNRHLVDAVSGARIQITQATAEQMAQAGAKDGGRLAGTVLLHKRDYFYWGPLPVYKVSFDDSPRTVAYVSPVTGRIEQTTSRLGRLHQSVTSIHTFHPLRLITEKDAVRKGLLILISAVGVGTGITGYYLALPVRRRSSKTFDRTSVTADNEELPVDF